MQDVMIRPETRPAARPARAEERRAPGGLRVLVVEDEPHAALDLCLVLEDLGCLPVGPAGSIDAAMPLATLHPIDVALLDENLGATLVTPIAHALARRGVPFVVLSGRGRPMTTNSLIVEAPRLPKPARIAQIRQAILSATAPR